jgi:hypothetical protein
VRQSQKVQVTDEESGDQPKLVSSLSVPFGSPGLQQMPKEKETQDQTIGTERVFAESDALDYLHATPVVVTQSQSRIVSDPENGNRDDHIGASLHQPSQRFFEIRFRKDDQRHDRMTKNFGRPFE